MTTNYIDPGSLHIGHYADAARAPASHDHFDVSGMFGLTPEGTVAQDRLQRGETDRAQRG